MWQVEMGENAAVVSPRPQHPSQVASLHAQPHAHAGSLLFIVVSGV